MIIFYRVILSLVLDKNFLQKYLLQHLLFCIDLYWLYFLMEGVIMNLLVNNIPVINMASYKCFFIL